MVRQKKSGNVNVRYTLFIITNTIKQVSLFKLLYLPSIVVLH